MPTAGAADTRCRCPRCARGRAQLPSLLPFWQQVSCAVPVPRIHSCRVHGTSFDAAAPPSLRGELSSPLRGCLSSLEAGGWGPTCLIPLGPKGVPNVRCATEGPILPEHSDDLRGWDPTDGRTIVWRVPEDCFSLAQAKAKTSLQSGLPQMPGSDCRWTSASSANPCDCRLP